MPPAILSILLQSSPAIFNFILGLINLKKSHPQLTQAQIDALAAYATTMDEGTRAIILADQAAHPLVANQ